MSNVYMQYFQKSKVFLYPLLGLRKGLNFVPDITAICWNGLYTPVDCKFLCMYEADEKDLNFDMFHNKHLKNHPLLNSYMYLGNRKHIYVFDYSKFKEDYVNFTKGKYSKFTADTKSKIINFFGEKGDFPSYIQSYLNPEDSHEAYADELEVDVSIIKNVWELCSIPDLVKETLFLKVPDELEFFKNNSLSLNK